ncbi:hypothetical protein ABIA33_005064 [Streptacidiphilus sp. MAP12-16]|uniref:hypothetical protein n=1 Tax=Streptacidiphilus sp. MAP12-16 TaxID=3156300 RepID=UPI0035171E66
MEMNDGINQSGYLLDKVGVHVMQIEDDGDKVARHQVEALASYTLMFFAARGAVESGNFCGVNSSTSPHITAGVRMFLISRGRRPGRGTVSAGVTAALCGLLLAVAVAAPQGASAYILSPVDGSYHFNANGWTGTLTVSNAENLRPSVVMTYDERGYPEDLTGTWSPSTGTLTVYRPLQGGVSQTYTLYLGNHIPSSPVFGGYFTESDVPGMRYGAYADDFVAPYALHLSALGGAGNLLGSGAATGAAPGSPTTVTAQTGSGVIRPEAVPLPDSLIGLYAFNGNGWTGDLLIDWANCPAPADANLFYDEIGSWQEIPDNSWNPSTGTLTLVRPLSGGVTQTYTLYEGTHQPGNLMFGGYFTESDVPGMQYAAFAQHTPGGVGC